jgi:dTDP-glucose pyrophosphorylase
MNILIPMAGGGTRFSQNGYKDSKPLIDVNGLPMIVRVLDNLGNIGKYVFVVREDAPDYHRLILLLSSLKPGCKVITTSHLTRGAAETCLLAKDYIQDDSLLIANCDQIEDWTPQQFMNCVSTSTADGIIVTYHSNTECLVLLKKKSSVIAQQLVFTIGEKALILSLTHQT